MIGWLDPSLGTANDGDQIIADAVSGELARCGVHDPIRLSTRRPWSRDELSAADECDLFVVGGTNLLASHPVRYRQWHVGPHELKRQHGRVVLFGVGWWQYQSAPDLLARSLLRLLLRGDALHSVRDTYTRRQLAKVPRRFVDTSCPTMWHLPTTGTTRHGFRGPVIATVTDYLRHPVRDRILLHSLAERADRLLVWPQGSGDRRYITELGFADHCLGSGLHALDQVLTDPDVEYVGTRLHAGIRALQRGVPAVVVAIDNRAREIAASTSLWTVSRNEIDTLEAQLDDLDAWSLRLPTEAISRWRREFASLVEGASA